MEPKNKTHLIIDITIRLILLLGIVIWCVILLKPFASIILWSVILAMVASPLYKTILNKVGGRKKLAAILLTVVGLLVIIIPSWLFLDGVIEGISRLKQSFDAGTLRIPLPNSKVKDWPVVGEGLFNLWSDASQNIEGLIKKNSSYLLEAGNLLVKNLMDISGSIIQMFAATIIAGVLLMLPGTEKTSRTFFRKIVGERGDEFLSVTMVTVGNVVKGVFGVAFIQAVLIGIGMLIAGVPYAGLWTLLVLIIAVLQLPAIIIVLPIIIYLFSEKGITPAILWSVYLLVAGAVDNLLKPILLGKGAPVPMLVIFLGVLGGFITSGFIGLFTGAIVLSIGYKLFTWWLQPLDKSTAEPDKDLKDA